MERRRSGSRNAWTIKAACLGLLLISVLAACGAGDSPETTAASSDTTGTGSPTTTVPVTIPTTRATTTTIATPAPIKLQGTGKKATDPFPIAGGMAVFHLAHSGGSNFIVRLATTAGESVGASLVNVVGVHDGLSGRHVAAGQYILNVEASGAWTVEVEQPRPTTGDKLPVAYDGKGPSLKGPFMSTGGGIRFALKHSGTSNFIVRVLNKDGQNVGASLVNEVGASDVSQVRPMPSGLYYLSIEADGPWRIEGTAT